MKRRHAKKLSHKIVYRRPAMTWRERAYLRVRRIIGPFPYLFLPKLPSLPSETFEEFSRLQIQDMARALGISKIIPRSPG